jgi:hypothetical protein
VLEQQQHVSQLAGLPRGSHTALQIGGGPVLDRAEVADEQVAGCGGHGSRIATAARPAALYPAAMEGASLTRLRWRLRGAWMWPAFALLTAVDALLLHLLPIAGDGTGPVAAVLLAAVFNIIAIAVPARMLGALLRRRRRRDLPPVVAHDYAGTATMALVTLAVLAAGLVHRPAIQDGDRAFRAQARAVRTYVHAQAPAEFRRHLARADTVRLEADLFRSCVPGDRPRSALCLLVNTDQSPAGVRRDASSEPNAEFARRQAPRQ